MREEIFPSCLLGPRSMVFEAQYLAVLEELPGNQVVMAAFLCQVEEETYPCRALYADVPLNGMDPAHLPSQSLQEQPPLGSRLTNGGTVRMCAGM